MIRGHSQAAQICACVQFGFVLDSVPLSSGDQSVTVDFACLPSRTGSCQEDLRHILLVPENTLIHESFSRPCA
jgi:hypothetical protein